MGITKPMKVLVLAIGNGINILVNFLALPYLVRTLSYEDYGTYGQVLIAISLLQGIFTFNLNQIINIHFAKNEAKSDIFSTVFKSSLLLAVAGMFIMWISAPFTGAAFKNEQLTNLIYLSLFNLFGQIPAPVLISTLVFYGKVKPVSAILVATNILKVLSMFVAIHFFQSVEGLMIGLSAVSCLQLLLFYFYVPKNLKIRSTFNRQLALSMLVMAAPLAITSIIEKLVIYIDGLMISSLLNITDYAIYRAGAFEVPFVSALYGSVATIVLPEVAKLFVDNKWNELIHLKRRVIATTSFFVYPILVFLLFFSLPIVSFYLSNKYASSAIIFAVFNLALLIRVNDYQDIIIVSGNSKFIFKLVTFLTLLNVALNYLLINKFGILGGAIAYIVHLFLLAFFLQRKTSKILQTKSSSIFNWPLLTKIIFLATVVCTAIWFLYTYFNWPILALFFAAPIYMLVFLFLGYKFALIDRQIADQFINKLKFKISKG